MKTSFYKERIDHPEVNRIDPNSSRRYGTFSEPPTMRTVRRDNIIDEWIDLKDYRDDLRKYIINQEFSSIYIVAEKLAGPCKIGLSNKIWHRMIGIRNGCWAPLYVFRLFWMPRRGMAYRIEQQLHQHHRNARLKGEWFDLSVVYQFEI
jgi:hypothetical protein